jgi:uncharacterized integral membrane protein
MEKYLQKELVGHTWCLVGVLFDQITTIIGLSLVPTSYESNQIVATLIEKNVGLWLLLDVTILSALFIGVHFLFNFCYRRIKYRGFFLILPSLIFGFLRMYCGIHNMKLALSLV